MNYPAFSLARNTYRLCTEQQVSHSLSVSLGEVLLEFMLALSMVIWIMTSVGDRQYIGGFMWYFEYVGVIE
jgi:hypothetical protein